MTRPWTDEEQALLRDQWEQGRTAGQIINVLTSRNRNEVIAQAFRMKLEYSPRTVVIPCTRCGAAAVRHIPQHHAGNDCVCPVCGWTWRMSWMHALIGCDAWRWPV